MRPPLRRLGTLAAACFAGAVVAQAPASQFSYQDLPTRYGFPVAESTLLGYALTDDQARARRHAWDLWVALTSPSASVVDGQRRPAFETWYSIAEVYNPRGRAGVDRRALRHSFKVPTQSALANTSRGGGHAGLMPFVKFNRPAADFIWDGADQLTPTLTDLNAKFDREGTAIVERGIKPFPEHAVALKAVFRLIKNPASQESERGHTALPIWDPGYPPPADGVPPMHTTWTNAGQKPELGDYIVLLGTHMTTKEMGDRTFQTFWWIPSPHVAPFGGGRPANVRPRSTTT